MKKIYVYDSIDEVIAAEDFEDVSAGPNYDKNIAGRFHRRQTTQRRTVSLILPKPSSGAKKALIYKEL